MFWEDFGAQTKHIFSFRFWIISAVT